VTLGELLRSHRVRLGLSQEQLADRSGLSVRALRDLEQDRVRRPRAQSAHRLAGALRLTDSDRAQLLAALTLAPAASSRWGVRVIALGSLAAYSGSVEIEIPPTGRALLGLLAVQSHRVVGHDEIVDVLWGDCPPRTCRSLIHVYVRQLRTLMEPQRARRAPAQTIALAPGGYRLELGVDQLDVETFDHLVGRAGAAQGAGDVDQAEALLARALRLWRGPVLADGGAWVRQHPAVVGLGQRRLAATLAYADIALDGGRAEEALAALRAVAPDEQLHEGLHARLMLALAGSGEQAAALQAYLGLRERLAEELGIEPGPELAAAHLRVLRQHQGRAAGPATGAGPAETPVPAQLPATVPAFTGREEHLRTLAAALEEADARSTVIAAIVGTAGVGKTALAVHWAHLVRDRFADGQLYVNLRGYASGPPLRPIEALARFLHALGIPSEAVPVEVHEASALFRSLVADRRMLILLDNANHPDQVRPLLPGGSGCHVIITSRDRLAGLVARDGARPLSLDVLTPNESHVLLGRLIGVGRVLGELTATADLAELCARLPLALRIAAANIASQPRHTVTTYTNLLREGNRLAALVVVGDEETAVRAAFDLSYRALPAPAQRQFRLLGLAPGPDVTAEAAAALADIDVIEAARLVDQLASANLLDQHVPGRYGLHDLMRLYALERVTAEETDETRRRARARLFDQYLQRVHAGARRLYDGPLRLPLPPSPRGPVEFRDDASASAWLDAERGNLLAAIANANAEGPPGFAWQIADGLRGYFVMRMYTVDWLAAARAGLEAAEGADDLRGQAASLISLGVLHAHLSRHLDANEYLYRALDLARRAGWRQAVAVSLSNIGAVYLELGRLAEAAEPLRESIETAREIGLTFTAAAALSNRGFVNLHLGRLVEGAAEFTEALDAMGAAGFRDGREQVRANLGETCYLLGHLDIAMEHVTATVGTHRALGNRTAESSTLRLMAEVLAAAGKLDEALAVAERAVAASAEARHSRNEAVALATLGAIKARLGRHREAVEDSERGLRLARATNHLHPEVVALVVLADARRRHGERAAAQTYAESALTIARAAGFRMLEAQAATTLAEIHADLGETDVARDHAERALELHRDCRHVLGEARTQVVLARLCWPDASAQAAVHAAAATALYERAGAPVPSGLGNGGASASAQPTPRQRQAPGVVPVDNGDLAKEGSTP
jgi:DNA-binding SARP family transcriptional activator/tetratricopeptide (TPR) repeat protein/DNA-binding XRE family transcriptional regulator